MKKSSVDGAGRGLFVTNHGPRDFISPGSVVAMFPGIVHLLEYTHKAEYLETLFPDPDFQLTRTPEGHIIDSRNLQEVRVLSFCSKIYAKSRI